MTWLSEKEDEISTKNKIQWNLREFQSEEAEDKVNKVNIGHSDWLTKPFTSRILPLQVCRISGEWKTR
jgi:hypothetical protein